MPHSKPQPIQGFQCRECWNVYYSPTTAYRCAKADVYRRRIMAGLDPSGPRPEKKAKGA